jgi:hypothetical protein
MTNLEIAAGLATERIWLWHSVGDGTHRIEPRDVKDLRDATLFVGPTDKDIDEDAEWSIYIGDVWAGEPGNALIEALRGA